jgi:uncharacterized RDD family membrane protein YckC
MAADESITQTRVCPRCGAPDADQRFCSGCGLNLLMQPELPSADEYSARLREEQWLGMQGGAATPSAGGAGVPAAGGAGVPSAGLYRATAVTPGVEAAAASGVDAPFAAWWVRGAAGALDALVLIVPAVIAWYTFTTALVGVVVICTTFAYFLLMARDGDQNGQTFGMQIMKIRVRRVDGAPVGAKTVVVRQLLMQQILGLLTFYLFFIPDYLWPLWDKEKRAIHDMVAKTRVVKTDPE